MQPPEKGRRVKLAFREATLRIGILPVAGKKVASRRATCDARFHGEPRMQ